MPVEKSAGIIVFRNTLEGRKYLVIRSSYHGKDGKMNFWDFPKGLLDKGEDGLQAAMRELKEEAGIEVAEVLPDFKETVRYFVKRDRDAKTALKFVALFLAEAQDDKVTLSWEHDAYEWLVFGEAKARVTRVEMKKALEKAKNFLDNQ